jgi:hypothetical protein
MAAEAGAAHILSNSPVCRWILAGAKCEQAPANFVDAAGLAK